MRFTQHTRILAAVVAVGALAALTGCAQSSPTAPDTTAGSAAPTGTIVVGSFAFPESEVLAEIYAQALTANGFDAKTQLDIGARQVTIPALKDGSINLIPEYNGNLLSFYNDAFTERTTEEVNAALPDVLAADNLVIYDSAAAEDKDAYVVRSDYATANGLTTIGDLAKVQPFSLGSNPQFTQYSYGLPGLASVYGVTDVTFVQYDDFGGPNTVKGLVDDTVQVADIYTTTPAIKDNNLVVLEDPKNMIAAQNITPLLSKDIASDKLEEVLNSISAVLTTDDLISLNSQLSGTNPVSPADAAKAWLTEKGLI